MSDPLQERVARVLAEHTFGARPTTVNYLAAAVLADLRAAGELRTYEQVGTAAGFGRVNVPPTVVWPDDGTPLYIVREDAAWSACPDCGSDEPGQLRWDGENGCTAGIHHRFHDIVREDTDE